MIQRAVKPKLKNNKVIWKQRNTKEEHKIYSDSASIPKATIVVLSSTMFLQRVYKKYSLWDQNSQSLSHTSTPLSFSLFAKEYKPQSYQNKAPKTYLQILKKFIHSLITRSFAYNPCISSPRLWTSIDTIRGIAHKECLILECLIMTNLQHQGWTNQQPRGSYKAGAWCHGTHRPMP